ncbi:MAG TPA: hypothetical protein VGD56_02215 [Gemmatirosa sp.]
MTAALANRVARDGSRIVAPAVCLGCGCACDDIEVVVRAGRIAEARHACPLGAAWFGDGRVPARALTRGRETTADVAIVAAAEMLAAARRPLVYLAPDLSCEAQREAVALADVLRAVVDSVTGSTAIDVLLAAQEHGRAGATLGEVRNRADVLLYWAVDPAARYPRYPTRYAPEPAGLAVPRGRRSRTVIAVDVGDARGPVDADARVAVAPADEVAVLTALRVLAGEEAALRGADGPEGTAWSAARQLAPSLRAARYLAIVHDAEPREAPEGTAGDVARDPERAGALAALSLALNAVTRCALSTLRAGGNRSGADAVLTSQTGYPAAVDFARGYPRYTPYDGAAARFARGAVDAVLVLGDAGGVPAHVTVTLGIDVRGATAARGRPSVPCAVVGPRASERAPADAVAAIDTGVAGIHDGGTAFRMDDVPLPLRPSMDGWPGRPPEAHATIRALLACVAGLVRVRDATSSARRARERPAAVP